MTSREQRTVRFAAIGIVIYLALFFGVKGMKRLEGERTNYQKMIRDARRMSDSLRPYEAKALRLEKLKKKFSMEPLKLQRATLVAGASAAIQQAAMSGGIELGPVRESSERPMARELTSMQLEASGAPPALLSFLHRLETLGFPLLLDAVQMGPNSRRPGTVKMNVTLVILDFDQWKGGPDA